MISLSYLQMWGTSWSETDEKKKTVFILYFERAKMRTDASKKLQNPKEHCIIWKDNTAQLKFYKRRFQRRLAGLCWKGCHRSSREKSLPVPVLFSVPHLHKTHSDTLRMSIICVPVTHRTWIYQERASKTGAELRFHHMLMVSGPLIPIAVTQSNLLLLLCSPDVARDFLLLVPLWIWNTGALAQGTETKLTQLDKVLGAFGSRGLGCVAAVNVTADGGCSSPLRWRNSVLLTARNSEPLTNQYDYILTAFKMFPKKNLQSLQLLSLMQP